jgi:hypothetical protein
METTLTVSTSITELPPVEPEAPAPVRLVSERCTWLAPVIEVASGLRGRSAAVVIIQAGLSLNRNLWEVPVLEAAVPLFEGVKVFYNHRDHTKRDFRDLAGEIRNVRMDGNRMVGVLEVLDADAWLQAVLRDKPHLIGLSVFVWAGSEDKDGNTVIKQIERVQSVDLVDDPAAGGGVLSVLERHETTPDSLLATGAEGGNRTASGTEPPAKTDDRKEIAMQERVNELEKALKEAREALGQKDVRLEEMGKQLTSATAAIEKMNTSLASLQRKSVVEDFLGAHRAELTPALEAAIRRDAAAMTDLTAEGLQKSLDAWKAQAEAIRKEIEAKAPVAVGLPPVTETVKAEAPAVTPAPGAGAKRAQGFVERLVGVI